MKTAYFSMEFAIDQSLKIYSGGLGFLAGSHVRSLYELKKDAIAIGILWTKGYYEQERNTDRSMKASHLERIHHFLVDANIEFFIEINGYKIKVKTYFLAPKVFGTCPIYFLTTDFPENDFLSRSISHQLYDPNEATRIAQSILLGTGGGQLVERLEFNPQVYHLNEAHALPLAFYLQEKYGSINSVERTLVFTTHTPEKAGNSEYELEDLYSMGYFSKLNKSTIDSLIVKNHNHLNTTATALKLANKCNGVSKIHAEISKVLWKGFENGEKIFGITNGQNVSFWQSQTIKKALDESDANGFKLAKIEAKKELFELVANQTGKLFDPNVLTIVWARRFAGYKRAWILLKDISRFKNWVKKHDFPVQIIWAGKPYPLDSDGINLFNYIQKVTEELPNCTILTGYELDLSMKLKLAADIWLNTPRYGREASGTSGMSAAMNGTMNLSIMDGWVPEYLVNEVNGFALSTSKNSDTNSMDEADYQNLMYVLGEKVIPMFYTNFPKWFEMLIEAEKVVSENFSSNRMVEEYYSKLYV